jgi:hypothetical protein
MPEKWTAFLDLLGTKQRASLQKSASLKETLWTFQNFCSEFVSELDTRAKIYFFSDSVFHCCPVNKRIDSVG